MQKNQTNPNLIINRKPLNFTNRKGKASTRKSLETTIVLLKAN